MRFMREDIQDLKPYSSPTVDADIILDANESFIKYTPEIMQRVYDSIKSIDLTRYPRDNYSAICRAYGEYIGVDSSKIIAGDGSDELIHIILNTFLISGDRLATIKPDFVMYDVFSRISGVDRVDIYKRDCDDVDISKLITSINDSGAKIFMFSNPNNPTGRIFKQSDIKRILDGVDCLVVVDEAYMEFADESMVDYIDDYSNLVVLRTCSKGLGLAAIRLGFCLCNEELRYELLRVKPPYNISCVTAAIGEVILGQSDIILENVAEVIEQRERLYGFLDNIDSLDCIKPYGNFIYMYSDQSRYIYDGLLERGIKIKVIGNEAMRITVGSADENTLVMKGIEEMLLCQRQI